ncbi:multidrug resistance protein, MATE family [Tistlia consotensis]|uniref:Multidrug resistance protein, MATE family n=1 Tax=Tistlia consotensis USBA 355 TaxID=560819 RepID=A0A1Y6C103_9PROT|nr:MATE family efflux transporter [Tistlia consotensis]SMF38233.1 multidrug resistance protein, MATE family [Tistlia consotensis USBA 355]SNR37291.1 multidrug resistance protein, MATE family [Tistlia consotensis]
MTDVLDETGAPLPQTRRGWHRRVAAIAGPIILSNASVPLVGTVDTAVMGRLPDPAYIGAVAVAALVFSYIHWSFAFLKMGTTGLAAQAFGAGRPDALRDVLGRALLLGLGFGLLVVLLQLPIEHLALPLVGASEQVTAFAGRYVAIRIWSTPAVLMTYAVIGWLLAVQNARAVFALQLLLNGLNVALNLAFVFGLGMDIDGVALASVIAEYAALAFGLWLIARELRRLPGRFHLGRLAERDKLVALLKVNLDLFVRTLCLVTGFAVFTAKSAQMDDVTLAGNAILQNLLQIVANGLDGFAHAAEVLVGGALGARSLAAFRSAISVSAQQAAVLALLLSLALWALGPALVALYTDIPAVQAAAGRYLPWMVLLPLFAVGAYQIDGVFIGATATAEMRNAMIAALLLYLAVLHLLLPRWGNDGLWLSLLAYMLLRIACMARYYPRLVRSVGAAGSAA